MILLAEHDETDREQVWQVPSYNIFDLHFAYEVPVEFADVTVFAHVFNLLNELYVQDATDNSAYNGYSDNGNKSLQLMMLKFIQVYQLTLT